MKPTSALQVFPGMHFSIGLRQFIFLHLRFGLMLILVFFCFNASSQSLLPYVQPLSGTSASNTAAALKHGEGTEFLANTIPAVGRPFGMTQWTPETRRSEKKCQAPYYYKDQLFSGFRGSHWISGSCMQDYGSVTLMPVKGALKTSSKEYTTDFSHESESAAPHHYKIGLYENALICDLTATARSAIFQFEMKETDSLHFLLTPNSDEGQGFIEIDTVLNEIRGYNPVHRIYQGWGAEAGFSGYFCMKINRLAAQWKVFEGASTMDQLRIQQRPDMGAVASFFLKEGEKVLVKIGTSFTSMEAARNNLLMEIPEWDFVWALVGNAAAWQTSLAKINVTTANETHKRIFYTALYHAMQHPRLYSDVDGKYPAFTGKKGILKSRKGNYYDDFSMWDIYRAQLPLFEILDPGLISSFVRSMILKAQQGGWLPIFPCWNSYTAAMIGDHVTPFIASAYIKGIRNFDAKAAYKAMRKNAFEMAPEKEYAAGMGRRAMDSYLKKGYIPMEDSVPLAFHKKEQVSRTLEYAYDDYALSRMAEALRKKTDALVLEKRTLNYKNVFDTSVHLVRGRYEDGSWVKPFKPDTRESYITEGTPRQYTFYVPQDIPGLAELMGGEKRLEQSLDSLFLKGEYWHGNEPGHQIPFLYNFTAAPWKTQERVALIREEEYGDGPGGLSGNDDAGQMSAWYVFAAMGFYPVDPVSGEYLLTTPLFEKSVIRVGDTKKFEVVCVKNTPGAKYIQSVKINGKEYTKNYITYPLIMGGGVMEILLGERPGNWGMDASSRPKGLSK